jgi:hypothetical protein
MEKNKAMEVESSSKVTPPELQEFSELLEREAHRKRLIRKNGSLNLLEKVNIPIWNPKFELEDFIMPTEQLHRVRSEPLMKDNMYILEGEEKENLMRGTKRVRGATTSAPFFAQERRAESISGRRFDLDLNKMIEDSFSSN